MRASAVYEEWTWTIATLRDAVEFDWPLVMQLFGQSPLIASLDARLRDALSYEMLRLVSTRSERSDWERELDRIDRLPMARGEPYAPVPGKERFVPNVGYAIAAVRAMLARGS